MDCHIILYPSPSYLSSYVESVKHNDGADDSTSDEVLAMDALHEFLYSIHTDDKHSDRSNLKWITGFELGSKNKKWHYHATLYGSPFSRENLRAKLNKEFQCPKKGLSIVDIKDPITVCPYTVKGKLYCSYGFTEEEVERFVEYSYEKEAPKMDFRKLLKKIEQDYLEDTSSYQLEDFVEKYLQAYIDYGKPIYLSHIKARLISVRLRKSPERLKGYVRDILDDLGLGHVSSKFMEDRKSYPAL